MNSRRTFLLWLAAFVGIFLVAPSAFAVLTNDNTNIGDDPSYGSGFSAFWRTGQDYAVLESNTNTYINTPSTTGTIFFRNRNGCTPQGLYAGCVLDPDERSSVAYFSNNGLTVGGAVSSGRFFINASATQINPTFSEFEGAVLVMDPNAPGQSIISLANNGLAMKPGGGPWTALSDVRTKRDEMPYTSGLEVMRNIHPVSFKYNGLGGSPSGDARYVGVNAQELESVAPSMVFTRTGKLAKDDREEIDIKHVDPNEFTYMLINSVQELDKEVRDLKKQLAARHCK
jgi:hypothetical protein